MDWFQKWFDSPYYHLLYTNRSETEAENFIKKIAAHLQIKKGAKVIDIACGKGRHARTLHSLELKVTGIDLSPNSIAYAKQFETETLQFAVCDMRQAYAVDTYQYAFNLFSSFGYFDSDAEDAKAIKAFADCLQVGGILVLDYINTQYAVANIKPREIIQREDTQFHIQKKLENGFIKKKIEFLANGEHYNFEEQLKVINLFKFEKMLASAGFKLQAQFGDYDLNIFNAATSPRLILIAIKNTLC